MKITLILLFFLSINMVNSQVVIDKIYLTRYCRNFVHVDNRYFVDTNDNPGFIISKEDYSKKLTTTYKVIPYSKKLSNQLILRTIKGKKEVFVRCILEDPKLKIVKSYVTIEDKFDVTLGIKNIKFNIRTYGPTSVGGRCVDTDFKVNIFSLINENGIIDNTNFDSIQNQVNQNRPDSIRITNLTYQSDEFSLSSVDTITLKFWYPNETDPMKWCDESNREIIKILGNQFKKSNPDTLNISANNCLYIKFDAGGTENHFHVQSLNYNRDAYIKEFVGGSIPLFNATEEKGLFYVSFLGDGGSGELYINFE